jgi:hypothetical protein
VAEHEFQDLSRQYAEGRLSRRKFIGALVAGGMSIAGAVAFASTAAAVGPPPGASGAIYGRPPVGTPANGGLPPGQGGTPYGQTRKP